MGRRRRTPDPRHSLGGRLRLGYARPAPDPGGMGRLFDKIECPPWRRETLASAHRWVYRLWPRRNCGWMQASKFLTDNGVCGFLQVG